MADNHLCHRVTWVLFKFNRHSSEVWFFLTPPHLCCILYLYNYLRTAWPRLVRDMSWHPPPVSEMDCCSPVSEALNCKWYSPLLSTSSIWGVYLQFYKAYLYLYLQHCRISTFVWIIYWSPKPGVSDTELQVSRSVRRMSHGQHQGKSISILQKYWI